MWHKLLDVEKRFEELEMLLSAPEIAGNRELFLKYSKEHNGLTEVVATFRSYKKAKEELEGSKELLASGDAEMQEIAKEEIKLLDKEIEGLEERLRIALLPKDPNDHKNVILEIRAGAGGDESGIFAGELFRMYTRYCGARG